MCYYRYFFLINFINKEYGNSYYDIKYFIVDNINCRYLFTT